MNKYVIIAAKVLLALPMLVFGFNKIFFFFQLPPPAGETALNFLGAMFGSYLVTAVALSEIAGAVMLWVPRLQVIGALFLIPITFNIVLFHLAHDLPGTLIGGICFLANILLLVAYRPYLNSLLIDSKA